MSFVKKPLLLLTALLNFISITAQVQDPIHWSIKTGTVNGNKVEVIIDANIDKGWHLYGTDIADGGPIPTSFFFDDSSSFAGYEKAIQLIKPKEKNDDIFGMVVQTFDNKASFSKTVILSDNAPREININVEYMSCNDNTCLPPTVKELSVTLPALVQHNIKAKTTPKSISPTLNEQIQVEKNEPIQLKEQETNTKTQPDTLVKSGVKEYVIETDATLDDNQSKSFWGFFIIAFLAGLAAILTPCVFPMIPMTVTFFMKDKGNKRKGRIQATVFGLSIISIYTFVGSILAVVAGPDIANFLSTHWIPNILFFLIFLVFAASFLGMFEITLPSWLINKSDSQVDKGGTMGSIFMAVTLVLVSFSCTGPIVGAILVESAGGEIIKPIVGMFGFSLAFALPFTLFAFFPEWLRGLPKSGGWLNTVKVVLGFIELALGLKFLSIADQTYHWGILDREIYLALWIIIFTLLGFYLLGKLRFSHDSIMETLSVPKLFLAIVTFSFVIYLLPGMVGAPLKGLAGYLPPQSTHDFDLVSLIKENNGTIVKDENYRNKTKAKYADILHFPLGLDGYFDYNEALAAAKKEGKPLFIDFTGHGCVNCREMEARVWSDPKVLTRLKNDYVLLALYVDDKTKLAEEEWYTSDYDGRVKKSIGKQNADFQIQQFNTNAQPYYVLLNHNEELLMKPKAYDLNIGNFVEFLDQGLANFNASN